MTDQQQKKQTPSALVIRCPGSDKIKVGALSLPLRWQKLLAQEKIPSRSISPEELKGALAETSSPILLGFENHVLDQLVAEAIAEKAVHCAPDEVVAVQCSKLNGPAPLICLGTNAAKAISEALSPAMVESPAALLSALRRVAPRSQVTEISFERSFWGPVRDEEEAVAATWELLRLLQWRPGGLVARYLNRPISLRISRLLINTKIRPNQVTGFVFLLGACGVISMFFGDHVGFILGAALMQLNSIIDGVDGELARTRYESSELGAYLDSVGDELLSAAMYIAMGFFLSTHGGFPGFFWIGLFTGLISLLYAIIHWHCKAKHGLGFYWWFEAYKPRKQVQRQTGPWGYLKKVFWKESTHFLVLLLAIVGRIDVLLIAATLGAFVVAVMLFIHIPIKRARW